jgi:hypothetical protein
MSDGLVLRYTRCNAPSRESDWASWYDEVHLPELATRKPGGLVTRWELTSKPVPGMPSVGFSHVDLFERARAGALLDALEATERAGEMHPAHCEMGTDILQPFGRFTSATPPSSDLRGRIVAFVACTRPSREDEWNRWYEEVHAPDMLDSGAFSAVSRWVRVERRRFGANYMTLYDVTESTVEEAVERSAAKLRQVVAAGRKLDCHVGALTFTLEPSGRVAASGFPMQ